MSAKIFIAGTIALTIAILGLRFLAPPTIMVSLDGNDLYDGRTHPVRTIQHAVELATHGEQIIVQPGIYRESVIISGSSTAPPLSIIAKGDSTHPVILRGSEPSSSYRWTPCTSGMCTRFSAKTREHVYQAVIPGEEAPTQLTQTMPDGSTTVLPLAKSTDGITVHTDRYQKNWWNADNKSTSSGVISDPSHLSQYTDITGSRAIVVDGQDRCGTYLYIRNVVGFDAKHGSFSTDAPIGALTYGHQESGANEYSVYMLENSPEMLDQEGEWYFDPSNSTLYLWPLHDENPQQAPIEIARRNIGFHIKRSNVHIHGFSVDRINDYTYSGQPIGAFVLAGPRLSDISIDHGTIRYAGNGIIGDVTQKGSLTNLSFSNLLVEHMTLSAITLLGGTTPGTLSNVAISAITARDIGFPYTDPAIMVARGSKVSIHNNTVSNTGGYGIHVTAYEKNPGVFDSLRIADNDISHACQTMSGCAALKLFGGTFSNTVVSGNSLHDNIGWSSCVEKQFGIPGEARGLFISNASGIAVFHNRSYNNAGIAFLSFTRQFPATDNTFVGNTADHSDIGIAFLGDEGDVDTDTVANATRHDRSVIRQNRFTNNRIGVSLDPAHPSLITLSGNTYENNATALTMNNESIKDAEDIQTKFPSWEVSWMTKFLKNIRFR